MKIIFIFILVQLLSVIIGTAKTIVTVNGGKLSAAGVNALNSGVATMITFLTATADFSAVMKVIIAILITFVGVYVVKLIEEKNKKERLWIYTCTINRDINLIHKLEKLLKDADIKLLYNEIKEDELYSLQIFGYTKEDSSVIKAILDKYKIKYYILQDIQNNN